MIRMIILLIGVLFFSFANGQDTVCLLNGNDLSLWMAFNESNGLIEGALSGYVFENGMIRLFGSEAGYLVTKASFGSFRLSAQFRWNMDTTVVRKSDKMNSGLMYLVPEGIKDTLWPKGIQCQIKQGATGDFILLQQAELTVNGTPVNRGPSVKVPRLKEAELPYGEWNKLEITFLNDTICQYLNGILVNTGCHPDIEKGRVLLQYEGFPIDFRNICIISF